MKEVKEEMIKVILISIAVEIAKEVKRIDVSPVAMFSLYISNDKLIIQVPSNLVKLRVRYIWWVAN